MHVKNNTMSYECCDLNQVESESIWCKIKVDKKQRITVYTGVFYRSQPVVVHDQTVLENWFGVNSLLNHEKTYNDWGF
jgi:hypothetical protein